MRSRKEDCIPLYKLAKRYRLSGREIFRYMVPEGLPIWEENGRWYANRKELIAWERKTKRIFFGHSLYESMALPAHEEERRKRKQRAQIEKRIARGTYPRTSADNQAWARSFAVLFCIATAITAGLFVLSLII